MKRHEYDSKDGDNCPNNIYSVTMQVIIKLVLINQSG